MSVDVSEIVESNVVALWLGRIGDFADLDSYIWDGFERDFGLRFSERNAPEIDAHETAIPVEELLDGFSFGKYWKDNALGECKRAGWTKANCTVVVYYVRYPVRLARAGFPELPLAFVGNIEWLVDRS